MTLDLDALVDAFDDIVDANRAYASEFDLGDLKAPAARGLAVLTCIDSRIEPLTMLGLQPGDAKILRNAGARVSDDALRSLVLATNLLNVRRVMVVAHTDCAMANTTAEQLATTLASRYPDAPVADTDFAVMENQLASLATDVVRIRQHPMIPAETLIAGFEYDVRTGLLRPVVAA